MPGTAQVLPYCFCADSVTLSSTPSIPLHLLTRRAQPIHCPLLVAQAQLLCSSKFPLPSSLPSLPVLSSSTARPGICHHLSATSKLGALLAQDALLLPCNSTNSLSLSSGTRFCHEGTPVCVCALFPTAKSCFTAGSSNRHHPQELFTWKSLVARMRPCCSQATPGNTSSCGAPSKAFPLR